MIIFSFCPNFSFTLDLMIVLHFLVLSSLYICYYLITRIFPVYKLCRLKYIRYSVNLGVCGTPSQGLLGCSHVKGLKAAGAPGTSWRCPQPLSGVAAHFLDPSSHLALFAHFD